MSVLDVFIFFQFHSGLLITFFLFLKTSRTGPDEGARQGGREEGMGGSRGRVESGLWGEVG